MMVLYNTTNSNKWSLLVWLLWLFQYCSTCCTNATEEIDRRRLLELMTSGRNGMIKFYQPWCGHCTRMKPDWDLLADKYNNHIDDEKDEESNPLTTSTMLIQKRPFIVDVNCQKEADLCNEYHTGGSYPTILVFKNDSKNNNQNPEEDIEYELYEGGRGYDDLQQFVDANLIAKCQLNVDIQATCTPKQIKYIEKWNHKIQEQQQTTTSSSNSAVEILTKEINRLETMEDDTMTYDLIKWKKDRIHILKQFIQQQQPKSQKTTTQEQQQDGNIGEL